MRQWWGRLSGLVLLWEPRSLARSSPFLLGEEVCRGVPSPLRGVHRLEGLQLIV